MGTRAGNSRPNRRGANRWETTRQRSGQRGSSPAEDSTGRSAWRRGLLERTGHRCLYCGAPAATIDHVHPLSRGGLSVPENCVPACLTCNGIKGDQDGMAWYRQQSFYDARRATALRAWLDGDLRLAEKLLQWSQDSSSPAPQATADAHQMRQAREPLWRWQMAS